MLPGPKPSGMAVESLALQKQSQALEAFQQQGPVGEEACSAGA